jgi:predicted regulator of Ras-like GTPase activity (Roadblock/LC7/MglB family)
MSDDGPPGEIQRDMESSEFAAILSRIAGSSPSVLVAAFVDAEGECIDYYTSLDPFEAKVVAAQTVAAIGPLVGPRKQSVFGISHTIEITTETRQLLVRRIDDEYTLVVLTIPDANGPHTQLEMTEAVRSFRREASLLPPPWEPTGEAIQVETRKATGWRFAPASFSEGKDRVLVTDVLGRWIEESDPGVGEQVCFMVLTEEGMEVTLVYEPAARRWTRRR